MKEDFLKELLDRYLRGECSAAEIQIVENWYNSFEKDEGLLEQLPERDSAQFKKQMLRYIRQAMYNETEALPFRPKVKPFLKTIILSISAIAAIFFSGILAVAYIEHIQLANKTHTWADEAFVNNTSKIFMQKILPDGSMVWLSPGTMLSYSKAFALHNREVNMVGDAFFEVVKNPQRPFVIYSDNVTTRVWGTSFRVSALATQPVTRIAVLTGKVSVSKVPSFKQSLQKAMWLTVAENQVMLTPGQQGTYIKAQGMLQKSKIGDDATLGLWHKANLSFNNTPLKDVVRVLDKTFSVSILTNGSELDHYHIRADFTNKNLADILEILHLSMNIAYTIKGNHIALQKQAIS